MRRAIPVLLALLLLAGTVPASALANTDDARDDTVAVGPQHFELRDVTVTISDTHIRGTGLPERSVDHASYTVDNATVSTDGFVVVYQDTHYRIGAISLTVDNVGLQLENVSVSDTSGSN